MSGHKVRAHNNTNTALFSQNDALQQEYCKEQQAENVKFKEQVVK